MTLVATNLCIWLHIVVKESIVEIEHAQHGQNDPHSDDEGPPSCDGLDSEILGVDNIAEINIYLFPFAIEFVLIGAMFFYNMYKKLGYM